MPKVALIGNDTLVPVFGLFGIDTFGVSHTADAKTILQSVKKNKDYTLIMITETYACDIYTYIMECNLSSDTYVMVIPDHTGHNAVSKMILKNAAEKALGADLLFKE